VAAHRTGRGLAVYAALIAASAGYGALGLALGFLPGVDVLRPHLPLHSTLLGGFALLVAVAVPTAVTAVLAWRRDPRAPRAGVLAGWLLVGWIVVEVAVVRVLSPLQPICLLLGVGLVVWAWSVGSGGRTPESSHASAAPASRNG